MKITTLTKLRGAWADKYTIHTNQNSTFILLPKKYIESLQTEYILPPKLTLSCALINTPITINELPTLQNSEFHLFQSTAYPISKNHYRITIPHTFLQTLHSHNITLQPHIFLITSLNPLIEFTTIILGDDENEKT